MDCEACLLVLEVPETLREPEETRTLRTHLAACPSCRSRSARLEAAVSGFGASPSPEPRAEVSERLLERVLADLSAGRTRREGAELERSSRSASRPPEERALRTTPWNRQETTGPRRAAVRAVLSAFAAAAALLLFLIPREEVRYRGAGSSRPPMTLEMQASIERGHGDGLERAENDMVLGAGDGVIFWFELEGAKHFMLLERDPDHRLRVLYERGDLKATARGVQRITLESPTGRPLRYEPDGPPGAYTWLAVSSDRPLSHDTGALDRLWATYVEWLLEDRSEAPEPGVRIEALRLNYASSHPGSRGQAATPSEGEAP